MKPRVIRRRTGAQPLGSCPRALFGLWCVPSRNSAVDRLDPDEKARNVMDVAGSVALVTGANRGLGASLCATLLVNNAGIGTGTSALSADAIEMFKQEFDTNVLGPLAVTQAFAPILGANGGGAIVNVLSVLSW